MMLTRAATLGATLGVTLVVSRPEYGSEIPNGDNVVYEGEAWPGEPPMARHISRVVPVLHDRTLLECTMRFVGVGHTARYGGGPRNPFGSDFDQAGRTW